MVVTAILSLLCGLVLFLYGVMLMGDGLNQVAGGKLEAVLYRLTSHPVKGIAHTARRHLHAGAGHPVQRSRLEL